MGPTRVFAILTLVDVHLTQETVVPGTAAVAVVPVDPVHANPAVLARVSGRCIAIVDVPLTEFPVVAPHAVTIRLFIGCIATAVFAVLT